MCDTASQGLRKRVGPARQASSFTEMDAFKSKKKLMVFLGIINQKRTPPPPPPNYQTRTVCTTVCDQIHD